MELVLQGEMPLQCSRILSHCVTPQNVYLSAHYSFSFVRLLEIEHTHAFFPLYLLQLGLPLHGGLAKAEGRMP